MTGEKRVNPKLAIASVVLFLIGIGILWDGLMSPPVYWYQWVGAVVAIVGFSYLFGSMGYRLWLQRH